MARFGASETNAQESQAGNEYERKGYQAEKRYRRWIEDGEQESNTIYQAQYAYACGYYD